MSANDGDVIKKDEFLHFYRLRKSKDPGYYEFKPWDRASRLILDYSLFARNWKPNFFFLSSNGWEFVPGEDLDEAPSFFVVGEPLFLVHLSRLFVIFLLFVSDDGV